MLVTDARIIWNNLKGVICVYKPSRMKTSQVRRTIINKVCTGKYASFNAYQITNETYRRSKL